MEFDLDSFSLHPSEQQLQRCRKADLQIVASLFGVQVPPGVRKDEYRRLLVEKLRERGVFDEESAAEVADAADVKPQDPVPPVSPTPKGPSVSSGASAEELQLTLRIKELELRNRELEVQTMHLRVRALELERQPRAPSQSPVTQSPPSSRECFDVSKHIALVPPFRESEVDSYFNAFERIAATLNWPKDVWPLLLQCKLVGKAQEVCATLTVEESLKYEVLKATVLRAYELVPEAYRQKFRSCTKSGNQTFVEFAREKGVLFDKWCQASKVEDFAQLRELVLLEEFKKCLPERIVIYLNEQKVPSLSEAAVLADEFALTHKNVFLTPGKPELPSNVGNKKTRSPQNSPTQSSREGKSRVFLLP